MKNKKNKTKSNTTTTNNNENEEKEGEMKLSSNAALFEDRFCADQTTVRFEPIAQNRKD